MTELEKAKYKILRYLNENHVRQNENLTEDSIRNNFYDINGTTYYNTAFEELSGNKQIDKTSPRNQWQIQPLGEAELNRLQNTQDLERNIEATEKNIISTTNLAKSGQNDKKEIRWNRWLTFGVALSALLVAIVQYKNSEKSNTIITRQAEIQEKQFEQQLKSDSISRIKHRPDTIYTIYVKTDTLLKENLKRTKHRKKTDR